MGILGKLRRGRLNPFNRRKAERRQGHEATNETKAEHHFKPHKTFFYTDVTKSRKIEGTDTRKKDRRKN